MLVSLSHLTYLSLLKPYHKHSNKSVVYLFSGLMYLVKDECQKGLWKWSPVCLFLAVIYYIWYWDQGHLTTFCAFKKSVSKLILFWKDLISFMTLGPGSKCVSACTLSFKDMLMWTSVQKLDVSLCHLSTSDASHDHIPSPSLIKVPSKQPVPP